MARVLVIGGTLLIGRALVDQLLERGDEVVIMHRGNGTPFGSRVGEIQCDRNDNLASYPPITQIEFVHMLAEIADRPANLVHVPREQIQRLGGELFSPPYSFGVYLDIPPIMVRADQVRSELGLELTPLEHGLRETYRWYRQQQRPRPDFSWEDRLLVSAR